MVLGAAITATEVIGFYFESFFFCADERTKWKMNVVAQQITVSLRCCERIITRQTFSIQSVRSHGQIAFRRPAKAAWKKKERQGERAKKENATEKLST